MTNYKNNFQFLLLFRKPCIKIYSLIKDENELIIAFKKYRKFSKLSEKVE